MIEDIVEPGNSTDESATASLIDPAVKEKYFYDFDGIRTFSISVEYDALIKSIGTDCVPDPSGVGLRIFVSQSPEIKAPILLPEIKVILQNEHQNSIIEKLANAGGRFNTTFKHVNKKILLNLESLNSENDQGKNINNSLDSSEEISGNKFFNESLVLDLANEAPAVELPGDNASIKLRSPRALINLQDPKTLGAGIRIAVIDSGIKICSDMVNVIESVDFSSDTAETINDHGTKSLSILAGQKESIVPESEFLLINLSVGLTRTHSSMIIALAWAKKKGAHIISVSSKLARRPADLQNTGLARIVHHCLPTLIVAGTSNSKSTCSSLAACAPTIAVSGLDQLGNTFFEDEKDIAAKVDCVQAGFAVQSLSNFCSKKYVGHAGASAATPLVAGALAIFMQRNPGLAGLALKEKFLNSCCVPPQTADQWQGRGLIFLPAQ